MDRIIIVNRAIAWRLRRKLIPWLTDFLSKSRSKARLMGPFLTFAGEKNSNRRATLSPPEVASRAPHHSASSADTSTSGSPLPFSHSSPFSPSLASRPRPLLPSQGHTNHHLAFPPAPPFPQTTKRTNAPQHNGKMHFHNLYRLCMDFIHRNSVIKLPVGGM